jgi:hypothetical protein
VVDGLAHKCYNTGEPEHYDEEQTMSRKLILYDRTTKDFAIYIDGELIGYARSYLEAEAVLDQLHMEILRAEHGQRVA